MWQPGQSGNPSGNNERLFYKTLRTAITQDNYVRLRTAAERLLDAASTGEPWAVVQLRDTLDGKPKQQVDVQQQITQSTVDPRQLAKEVAFILQAASAVDAEIVPEYVQALPAPGIEP